jgi:hypothetical protein
MERIGMTENVEMGEEPFDRLTHLCKVMADALEDAIDKEIQAAESLEEAPSPVKAIIFLNDDDNGGIEMFGFNNPNEGLAALMIHIRALFESQDKRLEYGVMTPQGLMILGTN